MPPSFGRRDWKTRISSSWLALTYLILQVRNSARDNRWLCLGTIMRWLALCRRSPVSRNRDLEGRVVEDQGMAMQNRNGVKVAFPAN